MKTWQNRFKMWAMAAAFMIGIATPQLALAATPYTWAHQVQETYVVTPGYYETQTYQSGWTTEQQQYVIQDGYWTTQQYISGYQTQYQSVLVTPGHYENQQYVVTPGYYTTEQVQTGTTTQQVLVSAAYTTSEQQWVSSGYYRTDRVWVSSGYTAYKNVWVSSGYTAYHNVWVNSGYEHYGGYYTYPYGHWDYYKNTGAGEALCGSHPCGGGSSGRIWVSGPAVWHSDNYWVNTSHWERESYWVDTSHYVKQSYWVDTSHYENNQVWVDTSHWETVSVYHPAVYTTQTVPVYSTEQVWVAPVYGTHQVWVDPVYQTQAVQVPVYANRQVWVDPVYGTRTIQVPVYATRQVWHDPVYGTRMVTVYTPIQPPVVNSASITPNPALDTDVLKASVNASDPAGYTIAAQQWTVSGPNGTTTSSTAPTHLMPGSYQISVAVQNEAPDGTPAAWSDPYTINETVNPAVVAEIDGVTLTGVVHPPGYVALPQAMPAGSPVAVESGYDITMHVASKGAGELTTQLYSGGTQVYGTTTSVSDGGGDVTFYIPTSVANKSTVDVKFTLRCTDPAGFSTTSVRMISSAFVVNGSSTGDSLVNQTH